MLGGGKREEGELTSLPKKGQKKEVGEAGREREGTWRKEEEGGERREMLFTSTLSL